MDVPLPSQISSYPAFQQQHNPYPYATNIPFLSPASAAAAAAAARRKPDRACDGCRRRKTRCDGPSTQNNVCSNCRQAGRSCTYLEASKPRGPPKAYINALEDRVERMESLLKRLRPDIDFVAELGPPVVRDSWKSLASPASPDEPSQPSASSSTATAHAHVPVPVPFPSPPRRQSVPDFAPSPSLRRLRKSSSFPVPVPAVPAPRSSASASASASPAPTTNTNAATVKEETDPYEAELDRTVDAMEKRLMLTELDPAAKSSRLLDRRLRYHGASAPILLATAAAEHRLDSLREASAFSVSEDGDGDGDGGDGTGGGAGGGGGGGGGGQVCRVPARQANRVWESLHRPEFWYAPGWELEYEGVHVTDPRAFPALQQAWPAPDLQLSLVDLYFAHFNSMFPLLHRPTFERCLAERLFERDVWFACVCMGVFAIASRHCADRRVLAERPGGGEEEGEEEEEEGRWHSAGVKYYYAAMTVLLRKQSLMTPSSLFEVQTVCLTTHFQRSTRWAGGAWLWFTCGIRKVQDVGAHRKRSYQAGLSVENELWKRAYWYLVGFDRTGSAAMGRTCSTRYEDADAELPLAVDDEYWETEDPAQAFRQPEDRPPARVTAFILWLRLTEITSFVLMHFYVVVDSPNRHGGRPGDEILKQLNVSLTEWVESVPDYLKWSPNIEDPIIANQSATLFLNYNMLNILIQSAFLPPNAARLRGLAHPHNPSVPGYPQAATALAVAVSAARAGTRVLEVARRRTLSNVPLFLMSADVFAAMLCLDVWIVKAREKARRAAGCEPSLEAMQVIEGLMADLQCIIACVESAVPRWETAQSSLGYLREAMPSPEDEVEFDDFHLETLPPLADDDVLHPPPPLTAAGDYGQTHHGQTQPFLLEQDGDPSRAADAASAAPSPPVFPLSPRGPARIPPQPLQSLMMRPPPLAGSAPQRKPQHQRQPMRVPTMQPPPPPPMRGAPQARPSFLADSVSAGMSTSLLQQQQQQQLPPPPLAETRSVSFSDLRSASLADLRAYSMDTHAAPPFAEPTPRASYAPTQRNPLPNAANPGPLPVFMPGTLPSIARTRTGMVKMEVSDAPMPAFVSAWPEQSFGEPPPPLQQQQQQQQQQQAPSFDMYSGAGGSMSRSAGLKTSSSWDGSDQMPVPPQLPGAHVHARPTQGQLYTRPP